ncbi:hypothetical protein [Rhodopseudomonas palustris]|nr:hypothetical protein [Rhodopseudomonas palustris]
MITPDCKPPRAANIPPIVRVVRLRTRLQLSAATLDAIALTLDQIGLVAVAEQLRDEANGMRRAARAS